MSCENMYRGVLAAKVLMYAYVTGCKHMHGDVCRCISMYLDV